MLHTKIKKLTASITAATVILCTSAFAANVTANTDVNVRSGPANKYGVVTVMRKGVSTEKLGTSGNWVKVKINGKTGYVYKRYLTDATPTSDKDKGEPTVIKRVVLTGDLNVRPGPGKNYKITGYTVKGEVIDVIGIYGKWYQFEDGGLYDNYISSKYTKDLTNADDTKADTKTVTITANSLHVRSGPAKTYKSLGYVKKGDKVTVTATAGDWYKIEFKKGTGYISKKYTK